MLHDAAQRSTVEGVGRLHTGAAPRSVRRRPCDVVVEAVDHEEVDELFAPFTCGREVRLLRVRREIEIADPLRWRHGILPGGSTERDALTLTTRTPPPIRPDPA